MTNHDDYTDLEQEMESYPNLKLDEDKMQHIHQSIMEAADQLEHKRKRKNMVKRVNVVLSSAAVLVLIVGLALSYKSVNEQKQGGGMDTDKNELDQDLDEQNPTIQPDKNVAKSFLKQQNYSIESFIGEDSFTLNHDLLMKQPVLSIELQTMGAYYLDNNELVYGSQSLMNKNLTIENYLISGHWREKFVNRAVTKVSVVLLNHEVLGGFTIPSDGESDSEGIWSFHGPATDSIVFADMDMDQITIAEKLFSQKLEKLKSIKRNDAQISKYKIQSIKILNDQAFHGFDFRVEFEVLPAYKDEFVLAGGMEPLNNGWVRNGLSGKVFEVKRGTYVLMSVGGGPVKDIKIAD